MYKDVGEVQDLLPLHPTATEKRRKKDIPSKVEKKRQEEAAAAMRYPKSTFNNDFCRSKEMKKGGQKLEESNTKTGMERDQIKIGATAATTNVL